MEHIELTILMPCLNEAETLSTCIDKAKKFLNNENISGEILIADNGSTDGSQKIAEQQGARVVHVPVRGYGAALRSGIQHALGKYVIMGDADDSYDFVNLKAFVQHLREGYQLVMGNRFLGGIQKNAMPFLNRYVGNPLLSFLGRIFFKNSIGDFHCGLRGFDRETMLQLNLRANGMEFASEMVVKASLHQLKIAEVATTLSPDGRSRPSHLQRWRDGWRHLKLLFSLKMQQPKNSFSIPHHVFILITGMIACGFFAVALGKELHWDLVSYHYYIPFSLLHHRWGYDSWPVTYVQMFFNPTIDLLSYFLIHYFPPILATFFLGAIHGINFWLIYSISYLVLTHFKEKQATLIAIMLAMVGMYNPVFLPELGSFMGDNLISLFGLGFILLQLQFLQTYTKTGYVSFLTVFLSGLLLGIGIGLKLTLVYVAIGFVAASLFLSIPFTQKIKILWIAGVGMLLGFIVSCGYWMWFMWVHYHSPFFPFFNGIFKASGFPFYNWHDDKFFPTTLLEKLFYPFYFSKNGKLISELPVIDYRLAVIYIFLLMSAAVLFWRRCLAESLPKNKNIMSQWLIIFFVTGYIAWQFLFSNIRYFSSLQILAPLIIYLLLYYLIGNTLIRRSVLAVICYGIVISVGILGQVRSPVYGKDYFNNTLPDFVRTEKKAMVVMVAPNFSHTLDGLFKTGISSTIDTEEGRLYHRAILQTYLIPSFPKDWQFVGVSTLRRDYLISEDAKKRIQNYSGPLYLLTTGRNMLSFLQLADSLGFHQRGKCGPVLSDRLALSGVESVLLCRVAR